MANMSNCDMSITNSFSRKENIQLRNETSRPSFSKLAIALARKYQAERSANTSEVSSSINSQNSTAKQLDLSSGSLKRENYVVDELIIKTEILDSENESTSMVENVNADLINPQTKPSFCNLEKVDKVIIKKEVIPTNSEISSSINSQKQLDPSNVSLNRENYVVDELIIKTEFSEQENVEQDLLNSQNIQNLFNLEKVDEVIIKKEENVDEAAELKEILPPTFQNFMNFDVKQNMNDAFSCWPHQIVDQSQPIFPLTVKEKKRPMTAAERARNMRARRRLLKIKKRPMTASERVKKCRELKKAAKNAIPYETVATNFVAPDPVYFPQYIALNHMVDNENSFHGIHDFRNPYLNMPTNTFNTRIFPQESMEIQCEPNIELEADDSDKPLEICTELFCMPIIAESTQDACYQPSPILSVDNQPVANLLNSENIKCEPNMEFEADDRVKPLGIYRELFTHPESIQDIDISSYLQPPRIDIEQKKAMSATERGRKYRSLKKEKTNPLSYEFAQTLQNNTVMAFQESIRQENSKSTAMTAAERMRRYRQRKKEQQKNKNIEENLSTVDSIL